MKTSYSDPVGVGGDVSFRSSVPEASCDMEDEGQLQESYNEVLSLDRDVVLLEPYS